MKQGVSIATLLLILVAAAYAQQALSQAVFDMPAFDPNSVIDPNTGLPSGIEEQISVQQIPAIPGPGETVSVQLSSFLTDLNRSTITWTLDGRTIGSQTGLTSIQFSAPQSGETSRLVVTITKQGGGTVSKTVTISPADVDLMYEAETYAHPFYKGKRLFTSESDITFIAIPNFITSNGRIARESLVYTWKVNGSVQQNISGYGRSSFSTKGSLIERPMDVTVEVTAPNSTLKATKTITVRSTTPEVTMYENNPILGVMYDKAIQGTFLLERPQVDFEGIPYFFSGTRKDDPQHQFQWFINGTEVTSKSLNENYMVLRNDQNQEGTAIISLTTNHAANILQTAHSELKLEFKKVDTNEQFTF